MYFNQWIIDKVFFSGSQYEIYVYVCILYSDLHDHCNYIVFCYYLATRIENRNGLILFKNSIRYIFSGYI